MSSSAKQGTGRFGFFSGLVWAFLFQALIGLIFVPAAHAEIPEYLRRVWQAEDGLPNSSVRALLQSKDGYLWLGTDESLVRFDGVHFEELDRCDYRLKNGRWMVGIAEGMDGSIWASACNGGLVRLQQGETTQYTTNNGLPSNYVLSICVDKEGTVWVGTSMGLAQLRGDKFVALTNQPGLLVEAVRSIAQDRSGAVWIGTAIGLSRYQDGQFTSFTTDNLLSDNAVYSLCPAHDGSLWVGTVAGLDHIKNGKVKHYGEQDGLAHKTVRSIEEDTAGDLWIGTHAGLQRLSGGKIFPVKFRDTISFEGGDLISDVIVYSVIEDREGNIWAGSSSGLNRLKPERFRTFTTDQGLSHNQITCGLEDRSGTVWIGTLGGGLNQFQNGKFTAFTPENGFPSRQVLSLYEDKKGVLWIGTDGEGLVRRNTDGTFTRFLVANGSAANRISVICADTNDDLIVAGNATHGAFRFKNEKFELVAGLKTSGIKTMITARDGTLWIGSQQHALIHWDGKTLKTYSTADGLTSDWVNALYEDADGALWIGHGGGGLNRLKNGKFTTFKTAEGVFNKRVLNIQEDHLGNLWLGTRNGIFSVPKNDLNKFAEGNLDTVNFNEWGRADGLRRSQCNGIGQPTSWKTRDARLWFALISGVVVFNPEEVAGNPVPPPVVIEEVKANNKSISNWRSGQFPPGNGHVDFYFTGLSFNVPEKVRFQHMLEGYETEWQDSGSHRSVRYTNLRPGTYRFRVKACNNDGVWNEEGASFQFTLAPHFYETYAFYSICILAIIVGGAGAWKLRMRRMKSRERELLVLVNKRTRALQQEIVDRKEAERRATVFSKLGQRLSLAGSQEQAAEIIVESADELIGWDSCGLYSYNAELDEIYSLINYDIVEGKRQKLVRIGEKLTFSPGSRRAIEHGAQIILRQPGEGAPENVHLFGDKTRHSASLLYVPIRSGTKVVGVVSIHSYENQAYDKSDLGTLQTLADYCGGAFERIRTEEALRESRQMVLRQERLAAVGQLSAGVAHEFNNILTIIKGHANLLLDNAHLAIEAQQSLAQITASADRAANLTRQMLAFSRKQVMQARSLDLSEVASDVTKILSRLLGENIALCCEFSPNLPMIHADVGMIEQIIMNLALNARDAMPRGGQIIISTRAASFTEQDVRGRTEAYAGDFVCLKVVDTGCGMDEQTLHRIFEPFFSTKEVGKGTGLGLSTVYGIVKQHRGWLEVESKVGKGSSFIIYFPVSANQPVSPNGKKALPLGGTETILFVEDEPDIRRLARQVLERYGYRVLEAGCGMEALKIWKENKETVDLLLTDMVMPEGMTGRDIARQLQAQSKKLKVIFTSGYSVDMLEKDFADDGFIFLPKPYQPLTLAKTIRQCLDGKSV